MNVHGISVIDRVGYSSESPNTAKTGHSSCEEQSDSKNMDNIYSPLLSPQIFDEDMFHGLDALILVYDITNAASFNNLNGWISLFSEYCIESEDVPILVLGNKKDLEPQRQIPYKQGRRFTHKLGNPHKIFREVTCKDNNEEESIKDIFTKLARNCINREASILQLMSSDSLYMSEPMNTAKYLGRNGINVNRSNDFKVKTCTEHICGQKDKYENNSFCVIL